MDVSGLLLIALCLGIGVRLHRSQSLPPGSHRVLNGYVLRVALPALIVVRMHGLFRTSGSLRGMWAPVSMAWIQFLAAAAFAWALARIWNLSKATRGALILTMGLANTSFVGFPLLEALLGPRALPIAVLADQPGSFLVFSTLGVLTAASHAGKSGHVRDLVARAIRFPPMMALLLAVLLSPVPLPAAADAALDKIAGSLVPVALVAVGMQLKFDVQTIRRRARELGAALACKLVLIPALMTAIYVGAAAQRGLVAQVTVAESAMAPMITSAVLAEESDLDPELANLMVSVGVLLSLVTVPLWVWLLGRVAG